MSENKFEKTFEIFRFIRTASVFLGLPTFYVMYIDRKKDVSLLLFKLYSAFIEIISWSLTVRMLLRLLIEPLSATVLVETACTVGYVIVELLRFTVLRTKKKVIARYFTKMEKIDYISSEKFLKIFKNKDSFKKKLGRIMLTFQSSMAIIVFLIGPFVLPPEFIKIPALYPFKNLHRSVKYFYVTLDFLSAFYLPPRNTIVDLTCLTFITFHTAQQEYLKSELKNILENEDGRQGKLREWFKIHQESLSLMEDLKNFLEPIILINYLYSLVCAVSVIFFVIEQSSMQMTQKIIVLGNITALFAFLGWFCNYVDKMNEQHESIPQQFRLDETARSKWLKNGFLILAPRCGRNIKISAMGFFTLSNKGFSDIVSTSVSLLAAFWQIRKSVLN